jgi:hypothetical protein
MTNIRISNREDCIKFLAGARSKANGRPIAKNLRVFQRGDDYAVQYHWTDIVTFHANGDVTLRNGSYRTSSTKGNINSFAPVSVWQKRHNWYIVLDGREIPFREGMRIDPTTSRIVN